MRVDIKTFMELRNAGYTAAEINAYAADLPAPDQGPEPAPAPVPESAPDPAPAPAPAPVPEPAPAPVPAPAPAPAPDNTDLLQAILQAVQAQNVNRTQMPTEERTTETILAEIINPPKR